MSDQPPRDVDPRVQIPLYTQDGQFLFNVMVDADGPVLPEIIIRGDRFFILRNSSWVEANVVYVPPEPQDDIKLLEEPNDDPA